MNNLIKTSFFLYILLLPSYLIKITVREDFNIPFLDILSIVFILLSALKLVQLCLLKELTRLFVKKEILPFLFIITGFTLAYFVNLNRLNWQSGLGIIKSFLLLPIISSFFYVLLKKKGILKLNSILLPLSISSGTVALGGYFYAILGKLTFDERLKIFFESPNQLAIFLGVGLLCTIFLIKRNLYDRKTFLFFLLISGFFQLFCLYLTKSQGALIGLSLAIPVMFLSMKNLVRYKKMVLFLVLSLSFLIFFTSAILQWTSYKQAIPATSIDSRMTIYSVSHKIIRDNFLYGIGPGNFQSFYLGYQKYFPQYPQWAVPHAHNNILHFWSEGGILAFFGIILIIFHLMKAKKQASPKMLAAQLILIYLFIHGIFDNTLWKNDLAVVFWIFASLELFKKN